MKESSQKANSSKEGLGIYLVKFPRINTIINCWLFSGNGIINTDGELWKVQRKAGLQFLSNTNLKALTDVALPKYLDDSIQGLKESKEGSVIDLEDTFHELTTILFGFLAFNVRISSTFELWSQDGS